MFWKQLRQIGGWTSVSLVTLTCGSWSKGQQDPYFMVQWFCLISWRLFDVWISYFGIMSQYDLTWPQNKYRSLWPIFHGPVILPYILKTVWCMNILLRNYESVWLDVWHKNKCRSRWPIFHGPVILPYILKTIWCMNIILWDYESVWHDIWPENKCRSLWHISWSSDFTLYLEDYLIFEHHTLGLWVSMTRCLT